MNNDLIDMMIANKDFNDIIEDIIMKQNLFCDYNQLDVNKQLEIALKAFVIMGNKVKIDIEEYNERMKESEEKYDRMEKMYNHMIDKLNDENEEKNIKIASLESDILTLKNTHSENEEKIRKYKAKISMMDMRINELLSDNTQKDKHIKEIMNDKAQYDKTINELNKEIDTIKKERDKLTIEKENLEKELAQCETERKRLDDLVKVAHFTYTSNNKNDAKISMADLLTNKEKEEESNIVIKKIYPIPLSYHKSNPSPLNQLINDDSDDAYSIESNTSPPLQPTITLSSLPSYPSNEYSSSSSENNSHSSHCDIPISLSSFDTSKIKSNTFSDFESNTLKL